MVRVVACASAEPASAIAVPPTCSVACLSLAVIGTNVTVSTTAQPTWASGTV
ncbi:MAG: hypothetical protein ACM31C_05355 [Acidobacteriota bacterium]